VNPNDPEAAVNADNGIITHLMGGAAPWTVVAGSDYSYDVHLYDDDDPVMNGGTAFSNVELTAMGPPPDPPEDGSSLNDVNKRIVIRAIGFGPRGTRAVLEQMLTPIKMPALLVDGDLTMGGNAQVIGTQGSVHANGDLEIDGNSVTIEQNATATGDIIANDGWDPGQLESGSMPRIPLPDIHAINYFNDADFVLQADGRITNKADTTTYCVAGGGGDGCRGVTPPGGNGPFGWRFNAAGQEWDLNPQGNGNDTNSATYYARTDVRITGSPGSNAAPVLLTVIAEGDIEVTGNPDLRPEPLSELQFVTDQDLRIAGDIAIPVAFEGRIMVREQIDFAGSATLAGQVIVQNVPSVSTLVEDNIVTGNVTLSYNGLIETVAYTVSGWRETPQ
jgi:cytoskeletal protein CcmA (bactofilin family)